MLIRNESVIRIGKRRSGFTLIELMVVVAIIALLIAILLPSLQNAREHAKTVFCGSNQHSVSTAMANYLFVSKGTYPAAYLYPEDKEGSWQLKQDATHPYGYVHFSYFLFDEGQVGDQAFQCPKMNNGGAPRTNPGDDAEDWEGQQEDQNGQTLPNDTLEDKQARRMAYGTNAAVIPRNKFTPQLSGGQRTNMFVTENRLNRPGDIIMLTEYIDNWKALAVSTGGSTFLSKSHRPFNPFFHIGAGYNEYKAAKDSPGFLYGPPTDQDYYGMVPLRTALTGSDMLDSRSGINQINAVGRHHPTADIKYRKQFGGSANFLFADGHVENVTVLETMQKRNWGDKYYSLSGANEILNMTPVRK